MNTGGLITFFSAPTAAYSNAFNLNGGAIGDSNANTVTLSGPITLGTSGTSPTSILGGTVNTVPGGVPMIISGPIGGGGNLQFGNGGAGAFITVSGMNAYTGTTAITAGTVEFTTEASLYNGGTAAPWTAANITLSSGATLALAVGGTSPQQFTASDVQTISGLGTATTGLLSGSTLALDTTSAGGSFVYPNPIANPNSGANVLNLVKAGTGALILTANNSYTGITTINSPGTLQIGNATTTGSLGTGSVVNNGTLAFNLTSPSTAVANPISGTGGLTQSGTGVLAITAPTNSYSGVTVISSGTLQARNTAAIAPTVQNPSFASPTAPSSPGYIYYGGSGFNQSAFVWTAGGNGYTGVNSGNTGPAVVLTGWGYTTPYPDGSQVLSLQKNSFITQSLTFAAADSYTLTWASEERPGSTGNTVNVQLDGTTVFSYLDTNSSGWTNYSTTLNIPTSGAHTITFAGTVTGSDQTTGLDNIGLTASASSGLSPNSPVQLASGASLDLGGANVTIPSLANSGTGGGTVTSSVSGAVTLTLTPPSTSTTTFSGVIQNGSGTVALNLNGAGTEILSNGETYTGGTTISAGTLQLGDGTTSNGSLMGNIVDNSALVFAPFTAQSFTGTVSGSGTLRQNGPATLTLSSAQSYTGVTTVSSGTLRMSASSANLVPNSAAIDVAGGTLDATSLTSSTLTLSTGQALSGAGTVLGSVIVPSGGILAPGANTNPNTTLGAIGTLTLSTPGNLTINSGAALDYDLGSSGKSDLASLAGALTLPTSGTINVNLANNANAGGLGSIGNGTYQILSAGSLTNAFNPSDFVIHASPLAGGTYAFSQVGNAIDLTITGATGTASGIGTQVAIGGGGANYDAAVGLNAKRPTSTPSI